MASRFERRFWRVVKMNDADIYRLAHSNTELSHPARLALMMNARYNKRAVRDDDKWVTINGTHVLIGEGGNVKAGPSNLKSHSQKAEMTKPASPSGSGRIVNPSRSQAVSSGRFVPALDTAKSTCPPETAWRVDSTRKAKDFDDQGIRTNVTEGGSTFAIKPDGDIISVCKNCNGKDRGTEIIAAAVKAGGTHLDSYDGNYDFYTRCGFEVVSRCKFDEEYAPPGWTKGRDKEEDVLFMKYVGPGKTRDTDIEAMRKRVPYSSDYDAAEAVIKKQIRGGAKK